MKTLRLQPQDQTGLRNFSRDITKIDSAVDMEKVLTDLCTPAELQAMVDRWQVVPLLQQGLSYRDIHAKTGVSVTTIGRVARTMQFGAGGYKILLKRSGLLNE